MSEDPNRRRDPAPAKGGSVPGPKPAAKTTPKPDADTSDAGATKRK